MAERNLRAASNKSGERHGGKPLLLHSVSAAALATLIAVLPTPAEAQLAARRGALLTAPSINPAAIPGQIRGTAQQGALDRQVLAQNRAQQIRTYATEARAAVARSVPNGLQGLVVATGVTQQALAAGALQAARDSTGRMTWQGAALPVESTTSTGTLVQIDQTDSRAILSWNRFDVGAETTLQFNQKVNGVGQKSWIAVNRVVDPAAAPSQILGAIKADGIIVVVNHNGTIFAQGAQVSANSLLASSLDIGNAFKAGFQTTSDGQLIAGFVGTSAQDRNIAFIQNGLLQPGIVQAGVNLGGELTSALVEGFYLSSVPALADALAATTAGDVVVERGASLTAGTGGFVILTGPKVSNDGTLTATEGQVSLQAGQAISVTTSTGAASGADPFIRGLILRTPFGAIDNVTNTGLIETKRGYASLGTGLTGTVTNAGLISATTSVSRNGTISLLAGTVNLVGATDPARASGLVITPDTNGETIPQGSAAAPPSFKTSQIRIGGAYVNPQDGIDNPLGDFGPAAITFGSNALLYAPNANVEIGGKAGNVFADSRYIGSSVQGAIAAIAASKIDIGAGVMIDVSGVKDLQLDSSRNSLRIAPLKRNELRDTPNYRETTTDGSFTLNGTTVYVDPRLSGVRGDGVAYVGSPLLEAGSAASQIAVTASELMTKGGTLNLATAITENPASLDIVPRITIASSATLDISGGWVTYLPGIVRTSRLLTADGRVVNIGNADPNDIYTAVGDGYTEVQSAFGISRNYTSSILQGARYESGYDEGRDAGALIVASSAATLDGTIYGDAFAGVRQLSDAVHATASATFAGDTRKLQAATTQLPTGAYLRIGAFSSTTINPQTADIAIGKAGDSAPVGAIRLNVDALSASGIAALSLSTTAGVSLAAGSTLTLANGGGLTIVAGRAVNLAGNVTVPGGKIAVTTVDFGQDQFGTSTGSSGSPFRTDDDLAGNYGSDPELHPFDITVGGKLSTAGLWINDFADSSNFRGGAWNNGGEISLTVAPRVFVGIGGTRLNPIRVVDFSGSIRIASGALLDVSSGGTVGRDGSIDLTGAGGSVSLINTTRYASANLTDFQTGNEARGGFGLGGTNQSVQFTPYVLDATTVVPSLLPDSPQSVVSFETASIKGFGFAGGGTFKLVAPDIAMGGAAADGGAGPRIGLDFLQKTGFGALDLTANKSRFIQGLFTNGQSGNSAFLDTERFVIGNGETLDLTQTVLPSLLDVTQIASLASLATGADITAVLTPTVPVSAWDRFSASLTLGGITELDVLAGGSIVGAAEAAITVPRLYSAGTIRIAGGTITQLDSMEAVFAAKRTMGVRDVALGGGGLSDVLGAGTAGQINGFDENALVKADVFRDTAGTQRLTNGELFSLVVSGANRSFDVNLVFTGQVALNEGIHLATGSVTDLSGTALYNPRAPFLATGQLQRAGRVVAGGSIATARFGTAQLATGYTSPIDPSSKLVAAAGATIDLSGASGVFDERLSSGSFTAVTEWSDAGKLTVSNGALLSGATVRAFGGDDGDADTSRTKATGGVLDWFAPIISQNGGQADLTGAWLSADQLMASGFDTLVARDGFTTVGAVDLTLDKALIATTTNVAGIRTANNLALTAAEGSSARIEAGYISLSSSNKNIGNIERVTGAGSLTLVADAIDVVGAVSFNVSARGDGETRGAASLQTTGAIRLIGTQGLADLATGLFQPGLSGQLVSNGDLVLTAAQVYATTGTGDLQALLEARRAGNNAYQPDPFVIASVNVDGLVQFNASGSTPDVPYSAGTYLAIRGAHIEQNGVLRAPLGLLDIGSNAITTLSGVTQAPATQSVVFGPDSITSVSARTSATGSDALKIPYGTTTDLIEYFFSPGTNAVLSTMPVGELRVGGANIEVQSATAGSVRVDARGGGDVFAYEFISGTGGSRDVLDRFNPDIFSGNNGLQYADGRQVYALVPNTPATVALLDPIYSADYSGGGGIDLYGLNAGLSVKLDGAPGIPAGEYLLLPAHYALLPGGMRIVENVGDAAPFIGNATTLLDGSVIIGGVYATAGTGLEQSQRRSFTIQSQAVFGKYSNIKTTSASTSVTTTAQQKNLLTPQLARDAARVVFDPLTTLKVAGAFATAAATGGAGAQFDIGGAKIRIAAAGATAEAATSDYVLLTTDTLTNFNANSLSIGALRTDNVAGTTTLNVTANQLLVDRNVVFSAPELILAVGGSGSKLTIADAPRGSAGAQLSASGTLDATRSGDYIINATEQGGDSTGASGVGALLRLANGPLRQVSREGAFASQNSVLPATLDIGARSSITASAITLDSSRTFAIDRTARIGATTPGGVFDMAVSGDNLRLGGATFNAAVEAQFGQARNLIYRSPTLLTFVAGNYTYNNLTIDAQGIALSQPLPITATTADVTITAGHVTLQNSGKAIVACSDIGSRLCAGTGANLALTATDVTFGNGTLRTYGFDTVSLTGTQGMFVSGKGSFLLGNLDESNQATLNLVTPFLVDRTAQDIANTGYVRPDYSFITPGAINVTGTGSAVALPTSGAAPGARIAFQAGSQFNGFQDDVTIDSATIRATSGIIEITTPGSIHLYGTGSLQAGGYTRTFDDGLEKTTVSASGGLIKLTSTGSGTLIDSADTASMIVDNGIGNAGTLALLASQGEVSLLASLNPGIGTATNRSASLLIDGGFGAFDLAGFVTAHGNHFQGDIAIRSGLGDLVLEQGQVITADSVSLTADGGKLMIAGKIDTSGDDVHLLKVTDPIYKAARIDGGAISLFGINGVTLTNSARLISTTSGYAAGDARQARGGTVTIGIGVPIDGSDRAVMSIASGAVLDVSALRSGDRLISETVTDPVTQLQTPVYHLAPADLGGLVTLRAPLRPGNRVAVVNRATILGARELTLEAFKQFDLDALAGDDRFTGVSVIPAFPADVVSLDASATAAGKANFLADVAPGTLPDFVRNFSVIGSDGNTFAGYRLRPGIELLSIGTIRLDSNWNLAAGTLDTIGALDAGLLVESPLGAYTTGPLAGQTRYEVVASKEAALYENYVDMVYRVGGSVRGEAPLIDIRAGGNVTIRNTISDGFFAFHATTDADYINYQLGGGDRTYHPGLRLSCGTGDAASCGDSISFAEAPTGIAAGAPGTRITINVGTALQGSESSPAFVNAPYNPLANTVAAGGTGDPFGEAELFPLFADGTAAHSSSLKLVAGAAAGSSNPLQTDTTFTGSVQVTGEKSYAITATKGISSLSGSLELVNGFNANTTTFGLQQLLALIDSGQSSEYSADYYTVLTWGAHTDGAADAARTAALGYAPFQEGATFLGGVNRRTGVSARLRDVIAFLIESGFADQFAQGVAAGLPGFESTANLAAPIVRLRDNTAYVGTLVRTGDGTIDFAAATDIDLRRTIGVVTRKDPTGASPLSAQIGGTAVYTAGVRAAASDLRGAIVPQFGDFSGSFIPGPSGGLAQNPVFSKDGGAITLTAGRNILGRRDVWGALYGSAGTPILGTGTSAILDARNYPGSTAGAAPNFAALGLSSSGDQPWRFGSTALDKTIAAVSYNQFQSGVGTLAGGDITIKAGSDVSDLNVALDNSLVTASTDGIATLVPLGSGDLTMVVGRNLAGGQIDVAFGKATAQVGADVTNAGVTSEAAAFLFDNRNLLRVRVADATFDLTARGDVTFGGLAALGPSHNEIDYIEAAGFFSAISGVSATTNGSIAVISNRPELYIVDGTTRLATVLPPSLELAAINGDIGFGTAFDLARPKVMASSRYGQLSLLAGGSIANFALGMSDAAPTNMFGVLTRLNSTFPTVTPDTSDADLRQLHDRSITHLGDTVPARVVAGGDISDVILSLPKQARIRADGNIIDLYYQGQNVSASDITRITAGGDITGTTGVSVDTITQGRSGVLGNTITVGGPGSLFVEAGRNLGPFITSATGEARSEAGGIRTVGNEMNPWLGTQGANIYVLFGVAKGVNYTALQSTYLDPANLAQLDGDLFVQVADALGTKHPDRTRYSYAPVLATWLRDNAPDQFAAVFGATPPTGDALTTASYGKYGDLYTAFSGLDSLTRTRFLIDKLYFGELAAPTDPTGNSFQQFIRGYRAVQTLFPASQGYTDNLATYTTDPATVNADHPLGVPTKKLVNGQPAVADLIQTGNVDLRLSTIETARGGGISILGPGGNFVAGSVVRTSAQVARRVTAFDVTSRQILELQDLEAGVYQSTLGDRGRITAIPAGFEGVLTLRGGSISGFTDGSFVLNQSRLFTQAGGDITLWSSNGDLNAGQGPKSASNFPPVAVRFDPSGFSEVDTAGSVSGAGIGAFKSAPSDPEAAIRLIAPVGTVDAGDAGVRASGSVFVAAARVANADSISAGGSISGVPSAVAAAPPVPAGAASAIAANAFNAAQQVGDGAERLSRIFVDVLGYFGGGSTCPDGQHEDTDGKCIAN
jgi:filamentous hemagglutinin family protein